MRDWKSKYVFRKIYFGEIGHPLFRYMGHNQRFWNVEVHKIERKFDCYIIGRSEPGSFPMKSSLIFEMCQIYREFLKVLINQDSFARVKIIDFLIKNFLESWSNRLTTWWEQVGFY